MAFPSWGGWKRQPLSTAQCLPSCVVPTSHSLPFLSSTRRHCRASSFIVLCDAAPRKLYPGGTDTEKKKKKKKGPGCLQNRLVEGESWLHPNAWPYTSFPAPFLVPYRLSFSGDSLNTSILLLVYTHPQQSHLLSNLYMDSLSIYFSVDG